MGRNKGLRIAKEILKNKVHALFKTLKTTAVEVMVFIGTNIPRTLNREFRISTTLIRKLVCERRSITDWGGNNGTGKLVV